MKLAVKENINISAYTTMRTECVARFFIDALSESELVSAIKFAHDGNIPWTILGGGSNVVFGKSRYEGLVIRNRLSDINIVSETEDEVVVKIGSGAIVGSVIDFCIRHGYQGLEYHFGLPGTIGGAIVMNSKWTNPKNYFGDNLTHAMLIGNDGVLKKVDHEYFRFEYGYSFLQDSGDVLVWAEFRLKKSDPIIIKKRAQESLEYRKKTQPIGVATSGCYFKNLSPEISEKLGLKTTSAGYLIDSAGLKGLTVGAFTVSDKHANFIVNTGKGSPADLIKLAGIIKKRILDKYGIDLVEEVIVR